MFVCVCFLLLLLKKALNRNRAGVKWHHTKCRHTTAKYLPRKIQGLLLHQCRPLTSAPCSWDQEPWGGFLLRQCTWILPHGCLLRYPTSAVSAYELVEATSYTTITKITVKNMLIKGRKGEYRSALNWKLCRRALQQNGQEHLISCCQTEIYFNSKFSSWTHSQRFFTREQQNGFQIRTENEFVGCMNLMSCIHI